MYIYKDQGETSEIASNTKQQLSSPVSLCQRNTQTRASFDSDVSAASPPVHSSLGIFLSPEEANSPDYRFPSTRIKYVRVAEGDLEPARM